MPEIELHGTAEDKMFLLAIMLFPSDSQKRHGYIARNRVEALLKELGPASGVQLPTALVTELLDAPSRNEMLAAVQGATKRALVAGGFLATMYAMDAFPEVFTEPSVKKGLFVAREFAKRSRYGDGLPLVVSYRMIRRDIDEFREVAHLWAAARLHQAYPMRPWRTVLDAPEAIEAFMGIAGSIQDFACQFSAERQKGEKEPLQSAKAIWSVPTGVKRIVPPWNAPPRWLVDTVKNYRAPRSDF